MSYVYREQFDAYREQFGVRTDSERTWTVGYYSPDGKWHPDHDYSSQEQAAERVHYLNGGEPLALRQGTMRAMENLANAIRNMPHSVRMRP